MALFVGEAAKFYLCPVQLLEFAPVLVLEIPGVAPELVEFPQHGLRHFYQLVKEQLPPIPPVELFVGLVLHKPADIFPDQLSDLLLSSLKKLFVVLQLG